MSDASGPRSGGRVPPSWSLAPAADWLLDEGRFLTSIETLAEQLGGKLLQAGAPVARLRLSVRILHPLLTALSAVWNKGGAPVATIRTTHGLEARPAYLGSPLAQVAETGQPFRRRIEDGLQPGDHNVLHELAAAGMTDYYVMPMRFTNGKHGTLAVATDRAGGFDAGDIERFTRLARLLTPILEARVSLRLAEMLADTYIGPRSGRRVLDGRIRRGDVETIRAAIWFSDIVGWSRIANERPAVEAVAIANAYFDRVDTAVRDASGEVLKLIGDAVLAIFPVGEGSDSERAACEAALAAARQALEGASDSEAGAGESGTQRGAAGGTADRDAPGFRFGIGLHLGDVVYGNVGSETRLDFTVMGPAVNFAARIEKLTRSVASPVVLSADFARALGGAGVTDLGTHAVAGWTDPVRIFAPYP